MTTHQEVVDEKVRLQRELVASETRYRRLFESAKDGILILNATTGQIIDANPFLTHLLGYSRQELLGRHLWDIGTFKNIAENRAAFEKLCDREYIRYENLPLQAKHGRVVPVEFVSNLYSVCDEKVIQCNIRDISARKETEAWLHLQAKALESSANAILVTDSSGVIIWVNNAFTTMTGYTAKEAIGQNPKILKSGMQSDSIYKDMWSVLLKGQIWRGEVVNRRKDGSLYTEDMTITPVSHDSRSITHFIAVKQDVTLQRKLELHLRQSQKMEAIGQLAGGIAHDFNNVLAVVLGNTEILLEQTDSSDPRRVRIGQILQAASHAASLTSQLLAFGRQQLGKVVTLDLNEVVGNLEEMLRRIIREDIVIVTDLCADLACVKADPLHIEQILINLTVNARDAMIHNGRLSISTRNVSVGDEMAAANPGLVPGDYVVLAVGDTGVGMEDAVQAHIFEPFFTTKKLGHGTGLGLATVYGIVKQNGGYIGVTSEPGCGTTFTIYLPRVEGRPDPRIVEEVRAVPKGSETILIVEDSPPLLQLLRGFLETAGYNVIFSEDSNEAIRLTEQYDGKISLLITDVVMPIMGGRELAEKLTSMSPDMKVIYITGYAAADSIGQAISGSADRGFLQKPFTRNALIDKVRKALHSPASD